MATATKGGGSGAPGPAGPKGDKGDAGAPGPAGTPRWRGMLDTETFYEPGDAYGDGQSSYVVTVGGRIDDPGTATEVLAQAGTPGQAGQGFTFVLELDPGTGYKPGTVYPEGGGLRVVTSDNYPPGEPEFTSELFVPAGPKGDKGDPGDPGEAGPFGPKGDPGDKSTTLIPFTRSGVLTIAPGSSRFVVPVACQILEVRAAVGDASTGDSVIVDVNRNGVTVFVLQANRPTIPAGANASDNAVPDVTDLAAGDYLTIDVDQIGSGTPGSDLVVTLHLSVG